MKLSGLVLCLTMLLPVAAWAGNFKYDYAEINYQHISPRTGDSSKGPAIDLSYTVPELGIQLLGSYGKLDTSTTAGGVNEHDYQIGIRGENAFGDNTDFYTDILYLNQRSTLGANTNTDNGYRLELGLRHRVNNRIEVDASLARDYLTNSRNQAAVGMIFNATDHLAVGLSYARDNLHDNTTMLRLRGYF